MAEPVPVSRESLIAQMRAENPELWTEIDDFCSMGVCLDSVMDGLSFPRHPCSNCGYNLYGNVSGICPECGELADLNAIERRMHTCQILMAIRKQNPFLWTQTMRMAAQRRDELLQTLGAERQRRREKALQSYLDWVGQHFNSAE